ncbi:MAG: MoxR family ATPase [Candidatus Thiodiazotropha sp.]
MTNSRDKDLEFEPLFSVLRDSESVPGSDREVLADPDSRQGRVYRMPPMLHLAVEVAMTTGRPLLLRGDPGTGKSSLAPYLARRLGWRYYEHIVTSSSSATDLMWRYDAVARLADAQARQAKPERDYLEPGVLWWALNRTLAGAFAEETGHIEPGEKENRQRDQNRAVVLIDEIDKAHPDLPNGLLVALGSNQIAVPHLDKPISFAMQEVPALDGLPDGVEVSPLQVVVTTNEERELPAAFVRRCVTFRLDHPGPEELVEIARTHFDRPDDPFDEEAETLAEGIAGHVETLRNEAKAGDHRPSTAEFLDAVRACRKRNVKPEQSDPRWRLIQRITLSKPGPANYL